MENNKGLIFSIITNILALLCSLFYVALGIAYIYQFNWAMNQDGEGYGFLVLIMLFGLPLLIVWFVIPIFRLVMIICPIVASVRYKMGKKIKGLKAVVLALHTFDLAVTFFISSICIIITDIMVSDTWIYLTGSDKSITPPITIVAVLALVLAYLFKYVVHVIAIILLIDFKSLKTKRER